MARRAQRHSAITHSPVVRSFIKPVKTVVRTLNSTASSSSTAPNPYYSPDTAAVASDVAAGPGYGAEPPATTVQQGGGGFLIPTQPVAVPVANPVERAMIRTAGSSDVKGKKRARNAADDDDADADPAEYDEATGTRYGVTVRYSEENLPSELEKYWAQRYRLFSLFDEGCQMDREGWYSVTPENIAAQIAERCRSGVILDAFCGVGGNAIQFAFTCERVIALDTSPVRLACAAHNAAIYGVADRIKFVLADSVTWIESYLARLAAGQVPDDEKIEVVFLSPPWGGIEYQTLGDKGSRSPPTKRARVDESGHQAVPTSASPATATTTPAASGTRKDKTAAAPPRSSPYYPLAALAPLHGRDLFHLARRITPHVAYFLPRNVDLSELAALVGPSATEAADERVEIEEEWMSGKLKAVTAYFGDLVAPSESESESESESDSDSGAAEE
ncbi:hypothetical protein JCM3774_002322 [Rhodotorula dairenensis]